MKIWIDVLTPKEVKFFKPMAEKLSKKHTVLCTSRVYKESNSLANLIKFKTMIVGRHGGGTKAGKMEAAVERMGLLTRKMKKFSPDLGISFCSPDAARVTFGLGVKHIAFSDMPHARIQMKLTIPLCDKLLVPYIYTKKIFVKYGIEPHNIIRYNAIDSAFTSKYKVSNIAPRIDKSKKVIMIRMAEDQASYMPNIDYMHMVSAIVKKFESENVIILSRYKEQTSKLFKMFGTKAKIIDMKYDGKTLLDMCDVFVGSGGSMTSEAALMGIPSVHMGLFTKEPHIVYLTRKKLLKGASTPSSMISIIQHLLQEPRSKYKKRAKVITSNMTDPYDVLVKTINTLF